MADHDVVPVPAEEGARILLPEPRLGVAAPERRLRQDAEGEERAAVGDLGVGVDEGREITLPHRTHTTLSPLSMLGPSRTFPESSSS